MGKSSIKGVITMNKIEAFWQNYCKIECLENIRYTETLQFGEKANLLASSVMNETKIATFLSYLLYEIEGNPLPKIGDYQIALNNQNDPLAILKSYAIDIYPFNEVPLDFALAKGEGTYEEWKEVHVAFFNRILPQYNLEFTEDMLTVCTRFEKVYPK